MHNNKTHTPIKLFAPVPSSPMQFIIIPDKLLKIEIDRTLHHIEQLGGKFVGYDPKDDQYITLASNKYKPARNQVVFDIKYIKKCANEKKLLNLHDFQISGEKLGPPCAPASIYLEAERCEHVCSAAETLRKLKDLMKKG